MFVRGTERSEYRSVFSIWPIFKVAAWCFLLMTRGGGWQQAAGRPKKWQFQPTDSTKINRPGHNIRMYWTNFRRPTPHVQQSIFGKSPIEVRSLHLYASFGTFCVQIGQLFAPQWVFEQSEEFRNRRHFPSKTANCRFSNILQRFTVPLIIDRF